MAITMVSQPAASTILPVYNPHWNTATSNQTAQPNFQFYVTVTVYYKLGASYTTQVYNHAINNPVDSILRFDSSTDAKSFVKNPVTWNTAGWSQCTNGIVKIKVNVGERYGSTPTVYPGTDRTYYAWNGVLEYLDWVNYTATNYVAVNGSTFPVLNDRPDTRLTPYSQNFLYLLGNTDATIRKATVRSSDGFINYTFDIANPNYNSTNWYDRYMALNISPYYLEVLGTVDFQPVDGSTIYIDIYDTTPTLRKTLSYTYSDICSKFDRYGLTYLNKKGAMEMFYMTLISEQSTDIKRSKVSHTPYYDESATGLQAYTQQQATDFVLSTSYNDKILLRSDWLTAAQSATLKELITSPVLYIQNLDAGTPTAVYPVMNDEGNYKVKRNFNGKLFQLECTVSYGYTNYRQNGI